MRKLLKHLGLNLRLLWNHTVFWTFPTPPETYYSKSGLIYFTKGNYRKAIALFLKSERSHHLQDITFSRYNTYYLGYSYLNLGDFRRAIAHFEQCFQLRGGNYQASSMVGLCYELISSHPKRLNSAIFI